MKNRKEQSREYNSHFTKNVYFLKRILDCLKYGGPYKEQLIEQLENICKEEVNKIRKNPENRSISPMLVNNYNAPST